MDPCQRGRLRLPAPAKFLLSSKKHQTNTMNLISKIKGMKLAALLVAAMTCFAAGAANRVYVEPFNIVDETPVDVPVLMDNDVGAVQNRSACRT